MRLGWLTPSSIRIQAGASLRLHSNFLSRTDHHLTGAGNRIRTAMGYPHPFPTWEEVRCAFQKIKLDALSPQSPPGRKVAYGSYSFGRGSMPGTQVHGLYGRGGQMDKFLYRQGIKGLCQCDRMIRSGSMRKGIFHEQHDNRYKNRAPSPRNKPFVFFNVKIHFFSFESFTTDVLTAVTGRAWRNSDANRKG